MQSSSDTSELIVIKEKELAESLKSQREVGQALHETDMEIIKLRLKRKELSNAKDKADFNVRVLNGDLRVLRHRYFSEKNSGI